MKHIVMIMVLLMSVLSSGCSAVREQIPADSIYVPAETFREMPAGSPIPPGYADLQVVSSIKTHRQGVYPLRPDVHGSPDYALLLTIDGQTAQLKGNAAAENCEPRHRQDPEAGDGIRYGFRAMARLKAGTHKIAVAIPDDEVTVTGDIALAEGQSYVLVLEPVYGTTAHSQRPAFYGATSFLEGVRGLRMVLQGEEL